MRDRKFLEVVGLDEVSIRIRLDHIVMYSAHPRGTSIFTVDGRCLRTSEDYKQFHERVTYQVPYGIRADQLRAKVSDK